MIFMKCDRCGNEMSARDNIGLIKVYDGDKGTYDRYDLCENCKKTLEAWLHPSSFGSLK